MSPLKKDAGRRGLSLLLGLLLLVEFIRIQRWEWLQNEQYNYGLLVPVLAAYLGFLRWQDRPAAKSVERGQGGFVLACGLLLLLAALGQWVQESEMAWRPALWAHGGALVGLMFLTMAWSHGWRWAWHFAFPLGLLLLAIPWFGRVEMPLTQGLMRLVSATTVEGLHLLGIYAERSGNLIRLANGVVGIEEACSGVRSLQATVMSAWFIGELFRYQGVWRIGLIALGVAISLGLNLVRTFLLSLIVVRMGAEGMNYLHDPVGQVIAVLSFIALLGCALFLKRWGTGKPPPGSAAAKLSVSERGLPMPVAVTGIILLMLPAGLVQVWYGWHERERKVAMEKSGLPEGLVRFEMDKAAPMVNGRDIPDFIADELLYTEGERGDWRVGTAMEVTVYAFAWEGKKVSSAVAVHRPEVCLPASGFQLAGKQEPIEWEGAGRQLLFEVMTFTAANRTIDVFYAVWEDDPAVSAPLATTPGERLRNVWEGRRVRDRRSLQIIIQHARDREIARETAVEILDRALRFEGRG